MDRTDIARFLDAYQRAIRAAVDGGGWHVTGVAHGKKSFTYTVGFTQSLDHPEVILCGTWPQAVIALNIVGELIREGARFSAGDTSDGVLAFFPVRFGAVSPRNRDKHLLSAEWLSGPGRFEALQLILPDTDGAWPGDRGYSGPPQRMLA